jgi:hypothetical protein
MTRKGLGQDGKLRHGVRSRIEGRALAVGGRSGGGPQVSELGKVTV